MRLVGSAGKVIATDKNDENVQKLGIIDVILMHDKVVNNNHQQLSKVLFNFVLINHLNN